MCVIAAFAFSFAIAGANLAILGVAVDPNSLGIRMIVP